MTKTPDGKWKWMTKESIVNSGCDCFAVANGSRDWGSGNVYRDDPPIDDSGNPAIMDMDHIHPGSTDYRLPLFVDDFLIESTTMTRAFHLAINYEGNPVLRPDKPWELPRQDDHGLSAMVYSDGVWYDHI